MKWLSRGKKGHPYQGALVLAIGIVLATSASAAGVQLKQQRDQPPPSLIEGNDRLPPPTNNPEYEKQKRFVEPPDAYGDGR